METKVIIQVVATIISLIAPAAFYLVLRNGIKHSPFKNSQKLRYRSILIGVVVVWTVMIYVLTWNGSFAYSPGDTLPKFLFGLTAPLAVAAMFFANKDFRLILSNLTFEHLAAGQFWRLLGAIFFLVAISGAGPVAFIGSGIGDISTGLLAVVTFLAIRRRFQWSKTSMWLLSGFGLSDLLLVLFTLLSYYPLWSDSEPSTAMAGLFPMMPVIGIAAPAALLLHLFMIRKIIAGNRK